MSKNDINYNVPTHLQIEGITQATKLLEKRRILYEVDEAYNQQKKEFTRQKDTFLKQEEIIKETDQKIQENLLIFCKFLSENKNKKNRAEKRYLQEKETKEQKEIEIKKEQEAHDILQKHQGVLESKISELQVYHHFLE